MRLNDLIDPITGAIHRHAARLEFLEQINLSGISNEFGEESARICENDIQNIVQPAYLAVVGAEPDPAKQLRALADCLKQLKDLARSRLPQIGNRPDEGYTSILLEGCIGAARAVYARISQERN